MLAYCWAKLRFRRTSLDETKWYLRAGLCARVDIALIVFCTHAFVGSRANLPQRKVEKMNTLCMNQRELSARWKLSPRTLERWRWIGEGPKFLKLGGRVVYRLSDIEEYEAAIIRSCTRGTGEVQSSRD